MIKTTSEAAHGGLPSLLPVSGQTHDLPGNAGSIRNVTNGNNSRNIRSQIDDQNAPLGSIAESSSTREKPRSTDNPQDEAIRQRFKLLKTARRLLPDERIAECMCKPAPLAEYVIASYDPERQSARYQHLIHCESASCPVCAMWKSEQDRRKLAVILAEAARRDLYPVMITLTLRHHMGDSLDDLRRALRDAFDSTFAGRWYADLVSEYGIESKLTAYETTYGKNGWHPHMHVLMFMSLELAGRWMTEFESKLRERWIAQLQRRGYDANWENGLTVETADSKIADYIAKYGREPLYPEWGADSEIAKAPVKRAHRDGLTPIELLGAASGRKEALERLSAILGISDRKALKRRAAALYCEYFRTFKGKSRLYIPAKLQAWLESETAIAALAIPEIVDVPMVMCSRDCWKEVVRRDLEAELLVQVRNGDAFKVLVWLRDHRIEANVPMVALEYSISGKVAAIPQTVTDERYELNSNPPGDLATLPDEPARRLPVDQPLFAAPFEYK